MGSLKDEDVGPFPTKAASFLQYACNLFLANVMEEYDAFDGENADGDLLWPEIVIPCFTENKIEGQIYRAHPSYTLTLAGPWHDWLWWVMIIEYYDDAKKQ
jgi:hypothetical protein